MFSDNKNLIKLAKFFVVSVNNFFSVQAMLLFSCSKIDFSKCFLLFSNLLGEIFVYYHKIVEI